MSATAQLLIFGYQFQQSLIYNPGEQRCWIHSLRGCENATMFAVHPVQGSAYGTA